MRPCHTTNSKDNKPVSAQLALQQIKIDIVEQPMEFLNGYFFNNKYNKKNEFTLLVIHERRRSTNNTNLARNYFLTINKTKATNFQP